MKNLNEVKANDKVSVMLNGKFSHKATVKTVTSVLIVTHSGDKFSVKTGESVLGKLSVTNATVSIQA